jgi:FkbM family methyltransferase
LETVFDIGMFDGEDTAYYLESGYRVLSVEANPALLEHAKKKFAAQLKSGQLTCVHAALAPTCEPVSLMLGGDELGSSSTARSWLTNMPVGSITVPGITMQQILEEHGVPYFLKVDIEGSDRLAVLALTPVIRPKYLSFEISGDVEELVNHAQSIGFTGFKIINQNSFRELANQDSLLDRGGLRLIRYLGYKDPRLVRRDGRFFISGHSSGPVPWRSDGRWYSAPEVLRRWREAAADKALHGWYDIHAVVQ